MSACHHILVVDDDPRIRQMMKRYLDQEGLATTLAADGTAMRQALAQEEIDLVLLDLVLPDTDGLQLAREVRATSNVPLIMVSGRCELVDRVVGLEIGADDYIAKPFQLREVLARIRSVLRRCQSAQPGPGKNDGEPAGRGSGECLYRFAGWQFEPASRKLTAPDGRVVELTRGGFDLLCAFVEAPQRTLTREALMDRTKGQAYQAFDRAIDAQVARLRKQIEPEPERPTLIKSVRGVGYCFAVEVARI